MPAHLASLLYHIVPIFSRGHVHAIHLCVPQQLPRPGQQLGVHAVHLPLVGVLQQALRRKPDPAAERAFDRSWALFHTKHRVEKEPSSSHRAVKIRWRIEAAVLIVIFLCVSAAAFGWKDYIITWKDELFGTVPHIPGTMELKEPNVSGYRSLKEVVQKYTDISVVPGWIPPGYTIDEIYEMEVESADVISATYRDGQKSIVIRVFCYRNTEDISDLWVEKDSGLYKDTYQTHGIEHAISENYGHTQIMWRNGQCTCSITGDISRADAERMINSIYENGG